MPRPSKPTALARLGEAIATLIDQAVGALLPQPEPDRIPVRVRERR